MKACPHCGNQNPDEAVTCSQCGGSLAPSATANPEPRPPDPLSRLVTVAQFSSQAEANLLLDELEAAGIEACIPEETSPVFSGIISLQPLTVRVAAEDASEARAIAAEWKKRVSTPDPEEAASSGKPSSEAEEKSRNTGPQKACVSCGAAIPLNAGICPKCGYDQPPLA